MRNTWIKSVMLVTLFLSFFINNSAAVDSKIRFRLYKKALQEVIEKNWEMLSEYAELDIGDMSVGDISIKNAHAKLYPEDVEDGLESKLEFTEGVGVDLSLNDFKFEVTGTSDDKNVVIKGDIESVNIRISVGESEGEYNIPSIQIEKFYAEIDDSTIDLTIDGSSKITDELRTKISDDFTLRISALKIVAETALKVAHNSFSTYLTESFESQEHSGDVKLSEIKFFESHVELGVDTGYKTDHSDDFRSTEELVNSAMDSTKSIELALDENMINTGLYSLYDQDQGFSLRKAARVDDPTNEYGSMFDQVLMSQVLGQGWKEILEEFGPDRKIDAECSFGKELLEGLVNDIKPSRIRFLDNSRLDVSLSFGCSVKVEDEQGNFQNFRSFFAELYAKFKLEMSANDAAQRIQVNGDVDELRAVRVKIFKQQESMIAEETAMLMMVNMGLNMLKSQISQALQIPQLGYPTIKECTGLTLLRPSVDIYDGFLVVSTDLGVKPAQKGCNLMDPPSMEERDPSEYLGSPGHEHGDNVGDEVAEDQEDVNTDL